MAVMRAPLLILAMALAMGCQDPSDTLLEGLIREYSAQRGREIIDVRIVGRDPKGPQIVVEVEQSYKAGWDGEVTGRWFYLVDRKRSNWVILRGQGKEL